MTPSEIYTHQILNLFNVTYTVSNKGKEIQFTSRRDNSNVKLYPTTGTFINNENVFRADSVHNEKSIKQSIKTCLKYHINENV